MTIWSMRITCWLTKATDTHSEYVILVSHGNSSARMCLNVTFIRALAVRFVASLTVFWDQDGRLCARFLY
jgi:hypothetical protein